MMFEAVMPKDSLHDSVIEKVAPSSSAKQAAKQEVCAVHDLLEQFKCWLKHAEEGLAVQESMIPDTMLRQRRARSSAMRIQFRMRHMRLK